MRTKWIIALASGAAIAVAGGVAFAQMGMQMGMSEGMDGRGHSEMMRQHMAQGSGMQGHGMRHGKGHGTAGQKGDQSPATLAFQGINAKMHEGMDIAFTGDADADFVKGMVPHHQGAVDMAKVVIAFGKDPEVRKLAEAIIKSQEEEIAWMKSWLQKSSR